LLAAGLALIAVTNAVVLLRVAYNRSGEPESRLQLSARELGPIFGYSAGENSGVVLRLQWRVSAPLLDDALSTRRETPQWLDEAKLASLGFDVAEPLASSLRNRGIYRWKPALLVLELDGAAYRAALEGARTRLERVEALHRASPSDARLAQHVQAARHALVQEETTSSRLFVVDAGPEREPLRTKYPERSRYAIVPGRVGMRVWEHEGKRRIDASVMALVGTEVHVPLEFRAAVARMPRALTLPGHAEPSRFEVEVAFGKRLEPWILRVAERTPAR